MLTLSRLGDRVVERTLLQSIQSSDGIFVPHDNAVHALKDVVPDYIAIFSFRDLNGLLQLEMVWHELDDSNPGSSHLHLKTTKWSRLDRDTGFPTTLLDASQTNLESGRAWKFELLATQLVDEARLPQQLVNFAQGVRFNPQAARQGDGTSSLINYPPVPGLISVETRTSNCFRILLGNSDYALEVSRFEKSESAPRRTGAIASDDSSAVLHEPRWSVCVHRTEWDTMLAQNEKLPIGKMADWSDEVQTWFPPDLTPSLTGDVSSEASAQLGWQHLADKLHCVEAFLFPGS